MTDKDYLDLEYEKAIERQRKFKESKRLSEINKTNVVIYPAGLKLKVKKIKLIKTNSILFILSKKHRIKEYLTNVKHFGYPLSLVPFKYRTREICEASVENNPNDFNLKDIPLEFLDNDFYVLCVKNGVSLKKLPRKTINLDLCKLSLLNNGSLADVPISMVDLDLCYYAIKINPNNVKSVPFGTYKVPYSSKKELYTLAFENGLDISSMPKQYVNKETYEQKIKENPRNIFLFPLEYKDASMWLLAVKSGLAVNLVPEKYVNSSKELKDLCRKSYEEEIKKDPEYIFKIPEEKRDIKLWLLAVKSGLAVNLVPEKYVNSSKELKDLYRKSYEEEIKKDPEYIFKIPEEKRDIKLWLLASKNGLPLSKIPKRYKKYYVSEDYLVNSIRNDYHNIKKIPESRLNTELYVEAINVGMSFDEVKKEFRNKKTYLAYANTHKKIHPNTPSDVLDKSFYDELVNLDVDNLKMVPRDFITKEMCMKYVNIKHIVNFELFPSDVLDKSFYDELVNLDVDNLKMVPRDFITKEMCMKYVNIKHIVNFELFPLRYYSKEFVKSMYQDAASLSDVLNGYLSMHEYYKLKSMNFLDQIEEYEKLLERFYYQKLLDEKIKIPKATDEEMEAVYSSLSYQMIKDLDTNKIFGQKELSEKEIKEISYVALKQGEKIVKESPRITYLNKDSNDSDVKKVASNFKERFTNIFNKDIEESKKDELIEAIKSEIDDLLSELDEHKQDVFNEQLVTYLENGNVDYDKTFKIIRPKYPYSDKDGELMRRIKQIKNEDYLNNKYVI